MWLGVCDTNLSVLMDFEAMREAYLRASNNEEQTLQQQYEQLKYEYDALLQRFNRVLDAVQNSTEAILRVAREGKTDS